MLAFKLRYLLESGLSVLILFGFFYLALRYFEGQRTQRESLRIAGLAMAPEIFFVLLGVVLPPSIEAGSALMTAISLSSWLVPVLVFVILWKVCAFTPGRAFLFAVIYLLVGFIAGFIFLVLRGLLPPFESRRVIQSLVQLGILLVPVGAWAIVRAFNIKVSPLAGSFLVALVFAPVAIVGHGIGVIPAFIVWMGMFMSGNATSPEVGYMFMFAIVSVIVTTAVISALYSVAQRLRMKPASPEAAD